ncbi:peroxisomal biogenesis factor 19-like [Physella acuta]|uniref:peroxisomal biogenesis factor 19-like n=1 Tax=Physella acuta TaxID=109671 RepID=UPI0027DC7F2A|nr:peroxisomal biogenesis factor 19-like [Physella acuta]
MASQGDNGATAKHETDQSSPVDTVKNEDPELDAILDSALADFDKKPENPPVLTGAEGVSASKQPPGAKPAVHPEDGLPEDMNYDFLADAMEKQFENTFSALLNDPKLKKQFEELADSAEKAAATNNASAFAETVEKALSGLNMNAESIQGDPNQQELWEQLAETLGAEAGEEGGLGDEALGGMGGMFQSMVRQLLSKELLYQPLKEVSQKYESYLEEKQHTLEPEKLMTYRKQQEIIENVVKHLEDDSDDHTQEEKNARFEVLLDLLQRMHELGNPPQEVVGEGNMMMPNFAEMGQLPNLSGLGSAPDPSQCSVM